MSHLLLTLIGFAGAIAVLASFAGSATGRLSPQSGLYHALNLGGGLALVLSSAAAGAWPSVGTNAVWAIISVVGLGALARARRAPAPHTEYTEAPTAELATVY